MANFILSCSSTTDISNEHLKSRDLPYVRFHYHLNGEEHADDMWQTISSEEFYALIAEGAEVSTSQVNFQEFRAFFESFLKEGKDILHVSFSSGLSGTYESACMARDDLCARYPKQRIVVIDSLCASSGYGLLMDMLADRRDQGASFDELCKYAENIKLGIHHWFFSTDLSSYIRGGRISKAAGTFGMILGICPLLNVDNQGKLVPREKVRSKKRVKRAIVEKMKEHAMGGKDYSGKCFISHSACLEDAQEVAAMIESEFPKLNGKVLINSIGTVVGAHTGCGTVALFFVGDGREEE